MKKTVLTIGTGKKLYVDMAANLARSFFWWHRNSDINFMIVTDQEDELPGDIRARAQIKVIKPGELGQGFSTKLHLDKLAPEGQTLFIDSDCLIFENLSWLFNSFEGRAVSVVGDHIASGEWFGDIGAICKQFEVPHIPKFNGGIYYIEKGKTATDVYTTARDLEKRYDEIGFVRLRNRPNDEVIMALSMQLHDQMPLIDDGSMLGDPQACPGDFYIDVIGGNRYLVNPPVPSPLHQAWYPFSKISPAVVHFLGDHTLHYPYRREVFRLKKALANGIKLTDRLISVVTIEYPERSMKFFKDIFRPIYHKLFGPRKRKASQRIVN